MYFLMTLKPPEARVSFVETFVWQPAPFQSPGMGLGSNETTTPNCQPKTGAETADEAWDQTVCVRVLGSNGEMSKHAVPSGWCDVDSSHSSTAIGTQATANGSEAIMARQKAEVRGGKQTSLDSARRGEGGKQGSLNSVHCATCSQTRMRR